MTLGTWIYTWLKGELVGVDSFGNRYYRERHRQPLKRGGGRDSRERRWVIYQGEPAIIREIDGTEARIEFEGGDTEWVPLDKLTRS